MSDQKNQTTNTNAVEFETGVDQSNWQEKVPELL
jgi:hypothetical protein